MRKKYIQFKSLVKRKLQHQGFYLTPEQRSFYQLTDKHKGQKAVIIGMGPSLKVEDLERLSGYTTFACNKIYLAFDQVAWRPDYYSICDLLVAQNNQEAILTADFGNCQPIHAEMIRPYLAAQPRSIYYPWHLSIQDWKANNTIRLQKKIYNGLYSGGFSVVLDQLQLAYAMGFSEVYLIGIDFNFTLGNVTERYSESGQVLESAGEVNHFHKNYRKAGETWTIPRMEEQRTAFEFCENEYRKNGRRLYNASRASMLDVIPKLSFDSVFPPKS
jgi:hypothetical protein